MKTGINGLIQSFEYLNLERRLEESFVQPAYSVFEEDIPSCYSQLFRYLESQAINPFDNLPFKQTKLYLIFIHYLRKSQLDEHNVLKVFLGAYLTVLNFTYDKKKAIEKLENNLKYFFIIMYSLEEGQFNHETIDLVDLQSLVFDDDKQLILKLCLLLQEFKKRGFEKFKQNFFCLTAHPTELENSDPPPPYPWLVFPVTNLELLVQSHLNMNFEPSLRNLFIFLDNEVFRDYDGNYHIHLLVLFSRYLKAKWPKPQEISSSPSPKELAYAVIGAFIIALKVNCDKQHICNQRIYRPIMFYLKKIPTPFFAKRFSSHDMAQIEIDFLRVLKLEINIYHQGKNLLFLGNTCTTAFDKSTRALALKAFEKAIEKTKLSPSSHNETAYASFIKDSLLPNAEDDKLMETEWLLKEEKETDDVWQIDSQVKRTIIWRR